MSSRRIAVFVDGDNISAQHSDQVLFEARKLGRVDIARVYADLNKRSDWLNKPGYRLMHAGTGKNAADLLLSIDAMELALEGGVGTFVIATSDGDFTHLAQRMLERGLHVLGLGDAKAPDRFRLACTEFIPLSDRNERWPLETIGSGCSAFDLKIRSMIAQHSTKGQGMRVAELGPKMHKAHGAKISTYPEKTWRAYLAARPLLYELDPRGSEAKVRFRPEGFASQ
ncbi:NYN domain-containing protein [Thalassovita mangrovi]|uniref:NYN domain-containing protein n=1 Tax=Thalassovita mangrovi TaxID=2692236 RepID=A0A6L8LDK0_9RHOB|nr:NYN domain-containing protein [Thalassovita mangrovi]MYM54121.1 NYN domain-containing protein [Thalassovita mangrovi]